MSDLAAQEVRKSKLFRVRTREYGPLALLADSLPQAMEKTTAYVQAHGERGINWPGNSVTITDVLQLEDEVLII